MLCSSETETEALLIGHQWICLGRNRVRTVIVEQCLFDEAGSFEAVRHSSKKKDRKLESEEEAERAIKSGCCR